MKPQENMSEDYQKQLIKYLLQCIASELSKIVLFSIIFVRFGVFKEFVFALILLVLLRTNGGGLHFKHYASCFIMSFLVFIAGIYLGTSIIFPPWIACIILLLCTVLGYKFVPIVSKNRPPARKELVIRSKRKTLIILWLYTVLVCVVPANRYINTGVWITIIHICQLLLAKLRERRNHICGTN